MNHPKHILQTYGLLAKKSLGQNFLFDDAILNRIVSAADLSKDDLVMEVGAGLGHLTRQLAGNAGKVITIELDQRFLPILHDRLAKYDNIELIHGDVLAGAGRESVGEQPFKVVSNVPYYITGAILRTFLDTPPSPTMMVMTVQKEVANRLLAKPRQMSLLAACVQFYGKVSLEGVIKAGAFWPRPNVDSAVIKIIMGDLLPYKLRKDYFRVVRAGFAQKRKQLQKNLRALGFSKSEIGRALTEADIRGEQRAQELSVDEWLLLTQALYTS